MDRPSMTVRMVGERLAREAGRLSPGADERELAAAGAAAAAMWRFLVRKRHIARPGKRHRCSGRYYCGRCTYGILSRCVYNSCGRPAI